MRHSLLRRAVDLLGLSSTRHREHELRQRRTRRAFLESLEDRRLLTLTGSVVASGGMTDSSAANSVFYLDGSDSAIYLDFTFGRDTSDSTLSGQILFTLSDDDLGTFTVDDASGVTFVLDSSTSTQLVYEFTFPNSSVTSGTAAVRFDPATADADGSADSIFVTSTISSPPWPLFEAHVNQRERPPLQLIAHTEMICPTCGCCTGRGSDGAVATMIQFGGPSSNAGSGNTQYALSHQQTDLFQPMLVADALLPNGTSTLQAVLSVSYHDGSAWQTATSATGYFSTSGTSGNGWFRFTMPVPNTDGSGQLPSGIYRWELDVTTSGTSAVGSVQGDVPLVNPDDWDIGFGDGWTIDGMGRLILGDTRPDGVFDKRDVVASRGVYLALGDSKVFFPRDGGGFGRGKGDFRDLSLEFDDTNEEYVISSPDGNLTVFGVDGLIKRREDRRGNVESFTFSSGQIASIVDAAGLETTFTYNTDEVVVEDDYGRQTVLAFDSGRLETVTWEDPDAGGVLLAPQEVFTYTTNGSIASRALYPKESNDPGDAEVTDLTYSGAGRVEEIDRPSGEVQEFEPSHAVSSSMGSSGAPFALTLAADVFGFQTNDGVISRTKYNEYGQALEVVQNYIYGPTYDPLKENVTTIYEYYDSTDGVSDLVVGMLKSVTSPDADGGGGGESAYVTSYEYYDATGLLHTITHPDSTTETFLYGTSGGSLNLVTQYADRLGGLVIYAYDSAGNRIRQQQVAGTADTLDLVNDPYNLLGDDAVTTWEYGTTGASIEGLPTAMIDARGMRTEWEYTASGQVEKVITAVGEAIEATRYFVYNANDQLEREYTELWNPDNYPTGTYASWAAAADVGHFYTELAYDNLGRLVTRTGIDPDGTVSTLSSPVDTFTFDRENRPLSSTNPVGMVTSYVYQSNGSYEQQLPDHDSNGLKNITTYQVDALGRVTSKVDPKHFTTSYGYDDLDRLTSTTSPDPDKFFTWNSTTGWSQSSNGSLASPVTSTVYDALSRPSTETDALGNVTNYYYSNFGMTVEVRRPSPGGTLDRPVTITQYDAAGNVVKVIDGKVAYNASASTAAAQLRWTRYVYDDLNRLIEVWKTLPDATSAPSGSNEYLVEQSTYDKNGNLLTSTLTVTLDGSGDPDDVQVTTNVYDERNRRIETDDQDPNPGNGVTTDIPKTYFSYDAASQMTSQTDPEGNVTDFGFDRLGRSITTTLADPDGSGTGLGRPVYSTLYDAADRVSKQFDPNGNYKYYTYDPAGNNWAVFDKDASNNTLTQTSNTFDANGNTVWVEVGGGRTDYGIDGLYRTIKITQPDPDDAMIHGQTYTNAHALARPFVTYVYDANSNLITETNELGKVTTRAYDHLNQLTSRTDPDPDGAGSKTSPVTSYTLDILGNRTSLTDPDGNVTSWTYDLWGNMLTEDSPLSAVTQDREFEYDLLGNLTKRTDHLGRIISYAHDLLGRTTSEQWSTIASSTVTTQIDYTYDRNSNLLTADEYTPGSPNVYISQYTYTYNAVGWLTSTELEQAGLVTTLLSNTFDVSGRRTVQKADVTINSVTTHDFQNEYGYSAKNNLTSIKQTKQGTGSGYAVLADKYFVFAYNDLNMLTDADAYANTSASNLVAHTDYDRDYMQRLTKIDHLKGSTHFATYTITNDSRSRITAIDDVFSNSAWNETHAFTYDHDDQLTAADHSVQSDEAYGFDANGNRSGNQTHLGATTSSTVTANNRISTDGVNNYTYDDEGNMLTKTNISTSAKEEYSWDHRNRLTLVTFKNSSNVVTKTVAYGYDHQNLLVSRSLDADGAGSGVADTTTFVHDNNQIVLMFYKSTPSGTLAPTDRLLWGPETDQLLSDEQLTSFTSAGVTYWALRNQINTVVDVATYNSGTDTTTIAKHRKFDAFGNITSDSATGVIFVIGFTGKYLDSATGLQNNINRWYAAWLGEWMTEDPIGFEGRTENLAEYAENAPTYNVDPQGLRSKRSQVHPPNYGNWKPSLPLTPPLNNKVGANIVALYDPWDGGNPLAISPDQPNEWATGCHFMRAANWIIDVFLKQVRTADDISANEAIAATGWIEALDSLYSFVAAHGPINVLYIIDHSTSGKQEFGFDILSAADFAYLEPLLAKDSKVVLLGCSLAEQAQYIAAVSAVLNKNGKNVTVSAYGIEVAYTLDANVQCPYWPNDHRKGLWYPPIDYPPPTK